MNPIIHFLFFAFSLSLSPSGSLHLPIFNSSYYFQAMESGREMEVREVKGGERGTSVLWEVMVRGVGGFHNCRGTENSWGSRKGGTLVNRSTKIQKGKQNEVTKWGSLAFGKQSDSSGGLNAKDRTNGKNPPPCNREKRQRSQLLRERKRGSRTKGSYVGAARCQPTRGAQARVEVLAAAATAVRHELCAF